MGNLVKVGVLLSFFCALAVVSNMLLVGLLDHEEVDEVLLEVDYYEHWNVTISNGSERSWSGFGRQEKILMRPEDEKWVLNVEASKLDGSTSALTIRIKLRDGTVLAESRTKEPFGTTKFSTEIY